MALTEGELHADVKIQEAKFVSSDGCAVGQRLQRQAEHGRRRHQLLRHQPSRGIQLTRQRLYSR